MLNLITCVFNFQPDEDLEDPDERHDPDSDMEVDDPRHSDETPRYLIFTDLFLFTNYMPAAYKPCFLTAGLLQTSRMSESRGKVLIMR